METVLHHLIQATGWSILHSLWQAALIYALLLPLQSRAFKLSAKAKYNLAYAANCLTFICFVYTFFSIFHWPLDINAPISFSTQTLVIQNSIPSILIRYLETAFPYLVLVYSIGLIAQSFIVIQGYKKVQLLKKASFTEIPGHWQTLFEQIKQRLGLQKSIGFRLSDHVSVPLVIGFFKPVILFPMALVAQMDTAQVEAILIHELFHIRRNDYLFNLIRTMIDTLLFFNPFVRLTGRIIDIEREHACDDSVVKITGKPLTYAHALLTLELLTDNTSPAFALAATGTNQHLYQRIKRITDMKTNYSNPKQKLFAITLTIATIVSLAWVSPAKNEKHLKNVAILKNSAAYLSDVNPLDTGKRKSPKKIRIVKITDTNALPAPLAPGIPPVPSVPPVPPVPEVPEAPEIPGMDINVSTIVTPEMTKAISDFTVNVTDMVTASFTTKDDAKMKKMQADIQKKGLLLQKQFNTSQQRAKWQKYAAEMQAKYNNPKERAKWEKLAREAQAKVNSPEQQAIIKEAMEQAQLSMQSAQNGMNSPIFRIKVKDAKTDPDRINMVFVESSETQKVKQTPEYLELKRKFDKDVAELAAKKIKKENN